MPTNENKPAGGSSGVEPFGPQAEAATQAAGQAVIIAEDDVRERILDVLSRYLSRSTAGLALDRAQGAHSPPGRAQAPADVADLFAAVERSASSFLDRKSQPRVHGELQFELARLATERASREAGATSERALEVRSEWDISVARARVREVVTTLGGTSWDVVQAMTLISELARNLVLYTAGGRVELIACSQPRGLTVRVTDQGPGISNLDDVLSGRYRSRTGLGKGLLGARRICRRFQIESDSSGTRIEAEMRF